MICINNKKSEKSEKKQCLTAMGELILDFNRKMLSKSLISTVIISVFVIVVRSFVCSNCDPNPNPHPATKKADEGDHSDDSDLTTSKGVLTHTNLSS